MKTLLIGIKNVLLWSYERGSWQYDLLCLLIILAVFLLPNSLFSDHDRLPAPAPPAAQDVSQANQSLKAASQASDPIRWDVKLEELGAYRSSGSEAATGPSDLDNLETLLARYLRDHLGREARIERFEPQRDAQGQPIGYRVWFR